MNPDTSTGQAWWTCRTERPTTDMDTDRPPEMKYEDQAHLLDSLNKALHPATGISAGTAAGTLTGFAIAGPLGAIVGAIVGAITGGVVADSSHTFSMIADFVFADQLGGPPAVGPSYEISSGTSRGWDDGYAQKYEEFWNLSPKGQFTEIFFDAQQTDYLDFIDEMFAFFRAPQSGKNAGYIAIRFMRPSDALLAMQRWAVTAAVEVVLVEKLDPDAKAHIEQINTLAENYDARFHWEMIRPTGVSNDSVMEEHGISRQPAWECLPGMHSAASFLGLSVSNPLENLGLINFSCSPRWDKLNEIATRQPR